MFLTYSVIILLFGVFETITNIVYLSKGLIGVKKAYSQHKEIPSSVSEKRMLIKVYTMLVVGICFILSGGYALLTGETALMVLRLALSCYALYTILEACSYPRHLLGWALAILISLLAVGIWFF